MFDQNASSPFFDPEWMFGVKDGFDIVIANPPYVSSKDLSQIDKGIYKTLFETAEKRFDLYSLFIEKGSCLACHQGIISYIVQTMIRMTNNFYIRIMNKSILLILLRNTVKTHKPLE